MSIVLEGLTKRYGGHPVVNNVNLEVGDGEFFVLLGSSGSGKTTILSLIAGLVPVDAGCILLHGRDVTHLSTQRRNVGFVFQNYALFQFMTVAENIEFGLSIRKTPTRQRRIRRDELLDLVGLAGLGERMPRQLSGGQQQRVALARALAYQPDVLLLDEPLGALDAKIRVELRRSLKTIQRQLGIATILVTHDQDEAFDLADRIGVMSYGRLLEVGTPADLYQQPQTEFVASFLGTANVLVGNAAAAEIQVGPVRFPRAVETLAANGDERVQVLFRPEDVALAAEAGHLDCPALGQGEIEEVSFSGAFERLRLRLPPLAGVRPVSPPVAFGSRTILVDAIRPPDQVSRFPLAPGEKAWVGVRRIHTLVHPGLSFLILTDGSLCAQAALTLGGQIARQAHARVTLLGVGTGSETLANHLVEARKSLGSGLPAVEVMQTRDRVLPAVKKVVDRAPVDLVVYGFQCGDTLEEAEGILQAGEHHLLLVSGPQAAAPANVLICVASGEPGKDDVLFAGRLIRHLSADVTLMTVLPVDQDQQPVTGGQRARAERFLQGGVHSLDLLGIPASQKIRIGPAADEILAEIKEGSYDLLVLGAPLVNPDGKVSLSGIVGQVLDQVSGISVLIVRSHYMGVKVYRLPGGEPKAIIRDVFLP